MTTYPLEFYRRSEQKWARRAGVSGACESTQRKARARASQRFIGLGQTAFFIEGERPLPGQSECDDILTRRPWCSRTSTSSNNPSLNGSALSSRNLREMKCDPNELARGGPQRAVAEPVRSTRTLPPHAGAVNVASGGDARSTDRSAP
jgi:hypothetical protein